MIPKERIETTEPTGVPTDASVPVRIIDCDVHPSPADPREILQFLPKRWRYTEKPQGRTPFRTDHIHDGARLDARAATDHGISKAGANPALMERQLLDEAGVDYAILLYHTQKNLQDPNADAARCAALNEWMAAYWLGDYNHHGRYRGSIRVPMHHPEMAKREIYRWAENPRFVQILAVHSYTPAFGHPMYEPVWHAAAECGLPVAIHAGDGDGFGSINEGTPFGYATYFFEYHALEHPFAYAAHLASLVCNGVLERQPNLKFIMVEGGLSWSHALENHLDKNWRLLRAEVPELQMLPSEYLRRQVLFTTQPIEEPPRGRNTTLLNIYEELGNDNRILFSTDYPHWDYDHPGRALPPKLSARVKEKIMSQTARALYGLPSHRHDVKTPTLRQTHVDH